MDKEMMDGSLDKMKKKNNKENNVDQCKWMSRKQQNEQMPDIAQWASICQPIRKSSVKNEGLCW